LNGQTEGVIIAGIGKPIINLLTSIHPKELLPERPGAPGDEDGFVVQH